MNARDVIADWLHGCYCPEKIADGHDIEGGYVAGAEDILDSLAAHGWRVVKLEQFDPGYDEGPWRWSDSLQTWVTEAYHPGAIPLYVIAEEAMP